MTHDWLPSDLIRPPHGARIQLLRIAGHRWCAGWGWRGMRGDGGGMTLGELEAAIRAAGWRGRTARAFDSVMLGDHSALLLPSMDPDHFCDLPNLAVVDSAAEVNEVLRAWGCV